VLAGNTGEYGREVVGVPCQGEKARKRSGWLRKGGGRRGRRKEKGREGDGGEGHKGAEEDRTSMEAGKWKG